MTGQLECLQQFCSVCSLHVCMLVCTVAAGAVLIVCGRYAVFARGLCMCMFVCNVAPCERGLLWACVVRRRCFWMLRAHVLFAVLPVCVFALFSFLCWCWIWCAHTAACCTSLFGESLNCSSLAIQGFQRRQSCCSRVRCFEKHSECRQRVRTCLCNLRKRHHRQFQSCGS